MKKIIFLDIDGVLNSETYFKTDEYQESRKTLSKDINEEKVKLLKQIVDNTGAQIVLSSSWRYLRPRNEEEINDLKGGRGYYRYLVDTLAKYGLEIMDHTLDISLKGSERGNEIRDWLETHGADRFIILDDESDMCEFTDTHLIQTSFFKGDGLEEHHVDLAIKMLNGDD